MYQLRNLINRSNVGKIPKNNFNSCDDFTEIVITAHVICAAFETMGLQNFDNIPSDDHIPSADTVWTQTNEERMEILDKVSKSIVKKHIQLSFIMPNQPLPLIKFMSTLLSY